MEKQGRADSDGGAVDGGDEGLSLRAERAEELGG